MADGLMIASILANGFGSFVDSYQAGEDRKRKQAESDEVRAMKRRELKFKEYNSGAKYNEEKEEFSPGGRANNVQLRQELQDVNSALYSMPKDHRVGSAYGRSLQKRQADILRKMGLDAAPEVPPSSVPRVPNAEAGIEEAPMAGGQSGASPVPAMPMSRNPTGFMSSRPSTDPSSMSGVVAAKGAQMKTPVKQPKKSYVDHAINDWAKGLMAKKEKATKGVPRARPPEKPKLNTTKLSDDEIGKMIEAEVQSQPQKFQTPRPKNPKENELEAMGDSLMDEDERELDSISQRFETGDDITEEDWSNAVQLLNRIKDKSPDVYEGLTTGPNAKWDMADDNESDFGQSRSPQSTKTKVYDGKYAYGTNPDYVQKEAVRMSRLPEKSYQAEIQKLKKEAQALSKEGAEGDTYYELLDTIDEAESTRRKSPNRTPQSLDQTEVAEDAFFDLDPAYAKKMKKGKEKKAKGYVDPVDEAAGISRGMTKDGQFKAAGFARRMADSEAIFDSLIERKFDPATASVKMARAAANAPLGLGLLARESGFIDPLAIEQDQAERNFINAILRRESGAAISASEFANADIQYFPRPGDSKETIKNKRRNRKAVLASLEIEAGSRLLKAVSDRANALEGPQEKDSQNAVELPKQGEIRDGLKYIGGNPGLQKSWVPVKGKK